MIILWGIYNDISTGFNININDCYFKSCFPLHCDIYARVETESTLTLPSVNVKFTSENEK